MQTESTRSLCESGRPARGRAHSTGTLFKSKRPCGMAPRVRLTAELRRKFGRFEGAVAS
ncbi:hypothetical protein AKJ09_03467 [Labilithrix luteola]|uniref:Uncharacterized protein n=1 Tax=Labilithrix luteola TaxID=1391654 RepID=A0A0K1PTE1_9BACT|nr:hypothetical protein AKJ09_03467 [Labilithrix luteola]